MKGLFSTLSEQIVLPAVCPLDVNLIPDFVEKGFVLFEGFLNKGFMDKKGNIVFSFTGNIISFPKDGVIMVSSGREWFKLNDLGNVVEKGIIEVIDDGNEVEYESVVYTEEDTWDAMTDGMYGDYPGGDIDYEVMGF